MAVDVNRILTLPVSKAFTNFRSSDLGSIVETRSESPPRKTPRLAADSDSASASRSRLSSLVEAGGSAESKGPIVIRVQGLSLKTHPANFHDTHHGLVRASIRILLDRSDTGGLPASYEKLYSSCRAVVYEAGKGEQLYEDYKRELEKCVVGLGRQLYDLPLGGVEWLKPFVETCQWFEKRVVLLKSILAYLDKGYVAQQKDMYTVRVLAYEQLDRHIFDQLPILGKVQGGIKAWVDWEREKEAEHELRDVVRTLIGRLEHHNQYHRVFEGFYLNVTRDFYAEESAKIRELGASRFVDRCEQRDKQERKRCRDVIPMESWEPIIDAVVKAQLSNCVEWVASEAVPVLLDNEAEQGLRVMYDMFSTVDGLKVLKTAFENHIQLKVQKIVKATEDEDQMVPTLLKFKAFCDRLTSVVLVDEVKVPQTVPSKASTSASSLDVENVNRKVPNREFSYAVIDAFQRGFKARRNKPAELIAKYLDKSMRKGQKGKDERAYTAELDAVLGLYRFTDDKDVFRAFYHRSLAKRLLLEKSASDDHEKAMLKKLKEDYDPEFGMGDHMFTDLQLSRDMMVEYTNMRERNHAGAPAHKLNVMVLQRSCWPFTTRKKDVALPEWMGAELQSFMNYYKTKHSGHKLDWDHGLGTATVRARFKKGEKELSVSLYQAIILLLFNEDEEKPFGEIKMLTQMEDNELRRTLQSLASGKKRVLKKVPPGKDVNDDDVFVFNADFTDPHPRVHINAIQVKETPEESKRTQSLIEVDRKLALDAAIVRVMKGKKEMQYEQLKTATIDAVKNHFKPDIPMIKQRVDSLVEQEYLKRHEDDMNLLIYLA